MNIQKTPDHVIPRWVRAFFAGILLLVAFSFSCNWSFYSAYSSLTKATADFANGDFEKASQKIKYASEKVPESEDLKLLSAYYTGINYYAQDKDSEALAQFDICADKMPADY